MTHLGQHRRLQSSGGPSRSPIFCDPSLSPQGVQQRKDGPPPTTLLFGAACPFPRLLCPSSPLLSIAGESQVPTQENQNDFICFLSYLYKKKIFFYINQRGAMIPECSLTPPDGVFGFWNTDRFFARAAHRNQRSFIEKQVVRGGGILACQTGLAIYIYSLFFT